MLAEISELHDMSMIQIVWTCVSVYETTGHDSQKGASESEFDIAFTFVGTFN